MTLRVRPSAFDRIKGREAGRYNYAQIFTDSDFRPYRSRYAYKFVTEETYSEFIRAGSFLVSSLARYRALEDQGDPAGDRFEGSSLCCYDVEDHELMVATLSGFDTFIFSAARDLSNAAEMKAKFGPVVLRIELRPFASLKAWTVGRTSPEISLVRYADLKLHRSRLSVAEVADFPPKLNPTFAKALRSRGRLPALFGKPYRFAAECEVRIGIQMFQDVPAFQSVRNQRLLDFVERIDV